MASFTTNGVEISVSFHCLSFFLLLSMLKNTFTTFPVSSQVFWCLEHTINCFIFFQMRAEPREIERTALNESGTWFFFNFVPFFSSSPKNTFQCFCSFCRVAWNWPLNKEIKLFRIHRLLSGRDMQQSLLPFDVASQYISYKQDMREPIRYVLDHLYEWQLVWYGLKIPRERLMWTEIYGHCLFLRCFNAFHL